MELACKPGSVEGNHSSGICVTTYLKRPTREPCGPHDHSPIWSCSEWGFHCHGCYHPRGALLPHHFNLTCVPRQSEDHRRYIFCCTFRRLSPPRRYLALCPVEPGLSSTHMGQRLPGQLLHIVSGLLPPVSRVYLKYSDFPPQVFALIFKA